MTRRLIFVYNADSGLLHVLKDAARKATGTDQCTLCAATYTGPRMKKDWKNFIDSLDIPSQFLHRDEFMEQYGREDFALPTVLIEDESGLRELIDSSEFEQVAGSQDLISLLSRKLNQQSTE